ncbi:MAG TPA: enoyl-CoA hydratase/isomerase family protein [Pyrinomonadaceae bacterium]|nr:enoyl-CoA hydratase/isomerase family protein [Pyrinomonadaceae bacterium]
MANSEFRQLIYADRKKVVEITLNRPDALNALSIELYTELGDAVTKASADEAVQIIVITGAGRAFSTGGDLKQGDHVNREEPQLFADASNRVFTRILNSDKTIIAKINGITQAGGLAIVAACDLAIASDQASFKCPEALVGIWEPYTPFLLTPQIGIKRTKLMLLASESIDAVEAERIGLINRVVPHAELDSATAELIEHVLAGGPQSRRKLKKLVNEHFRQFDSISVLEALGSEEAREGMAAFAQKRKPNWRE